MVLKMVGNAECGRMVGFENGRKCRILELSIKVQIYYYYLTPYNQKNQKNKKTQKQDYKPYPCSLASLLHNDSSTTKEVIFFSEPQLAHQYLMGCFTEVTHKAYQYLTGCCKVVTH